MRGTGVCLMAVMFLSAIACADSIPTYNLTQGTVTVVSNIAGNSIGWSFTGANGVSASGNGNSGAGCANSAIAGSSCDPGLAITSSGPNLGSATGSSAVLFFTGVGVNISGPTFTLPSPAPPLSRLRCRYYSQVNLAPAHGMSTRKPVCQVRSEHST